MARSISPGPASETSPLLAKAPVVQERASSDSLREGESLESRITSRWSPTVMLTLIMVIIMSVTMADALTSAPLTRIAESIICYKYYETHDPSKILLGRDQVGPGALGGVPEHMCKIPTVQVEVAVIRGWMPFFDGIPSLLLALPVGAAADRYGRKPVMLAGFAAWFFRILWIVAVGWFWQTLPIRTMWLCNLYGIIAGGSTVMTAVMLTVVADLTNELTRTTALLRCGSSNMLMMFAAPPLGAALMSWYNPWVPMFASVAVYAITVLLVAILPETLRYWHPALEHQSLHPRLDQEPSDLLVPQTELSAAPESPTFRSLGPRLMYAARRHASFLLSDLRVPVLLLTFAPIMFSESAREMMIQYASLRFSVSLADATYAVSVASLTKVVTLMVLVPATGSLITRCCGIKGAYRDLIMCRGSNALYMVGWSLVGVAPTIGLFVVANILSTLGYGTTFLARSFVTSLVSKSDVGKLYAALSLVETVALMGGGPILAAVWAWGLRIGGFAVGLPFFVVSVLWGGNCILVWLVRLTKQERRASTVGYESGDDSGEA